jgi:hypothetical protein
VILLGNPSGYTSTRALYGLSRTVTGHHHILRTAQLVGAIVPTITPSALAPSRASILDQLGEQVPGLMPQPGPATSPLLPETDATGVLVGYQGAARLAATFEVYCNGDYQGRGHLSSWGEDTVGLLDCATRRSPRVVRGTGRVVLPGGVLGRPVIGRARRRLTLCACSRLSPTA